MQSTIRWLLVLVLLSAQAALAEVKVFVMIGDSNMVGRGSVEHLNYLVYDRNRYGFLRTEDGRGFRKRYDVRVSFNYEWRESHPLEVGYALNDEGRGGSHVFGPEIGFGWTLGDFYDDQILIVKVADKGTRQGVEWLSPSSPDYNPNSYAGRNWKELFELLDHVFDDPELFVHYDGTEDVKVAGVVVFTGWNDAHDRNVRDDYELNLERFTMDFMEEIGYEVPVVVGELGQLGAPAHEDHIEAIREMQQEFVESNDWRLPVSFVPTRDFVVPHGRRFDNEAHFYGRADTYMDIGEALGVDMIRMRLMRALDDFERGSKDD